jgi:hypothetical protein
VFRSCPHRSVHVYNERCIAPESRAAICYNMRNERFTDTQAVALLRRLTSVRACTNAQARKLFTDLLRARLSDVVVNAPEELVRSVPDQQIPGFQKSAYNWLAMMAHAKGHWPPIGLGPVQAVIAGPHDMQLRVTGALGTMLTLKVYALLGRVGIRLRFCQCGQLFVKVKRQQFCSQRCQKRFQAQRLRADDSPIE